MSQPPLPEHVVVRWEGEHRFRGGRPDGPSIVIDGAGKAGPGAVVTVAVALATCSGVDVVDILEKRRTPAESLAVDVRYARAESPPRRITAVHLVFRVRTASERHHVERAVELSMEKYCSVSNSLRSDIEITHEIELEEAGSA